MSVWIRLTFFLWKHRPTEQSDSEFKLPDDIEVWPCSLAYLNATYESLKQIKQVAMQKWRIKLCISENFEVNWRKNGELVVGKNGIFGRNSWECVIHLSICQTNRLTIYLQLFILFIYWTTHPIWMMFLLKKCGLWDWFGIDWLIYNKKQVSTKTIFEFSHHCWEIIDYWKQLLSMVFEYCMTFQ